MLQMALILLSRPTPGLIWGMRSSISYMFSGPLRGLATEYRQHGALLRYDTLRYAGHVRWRTRSLSSRPLL